MPAAPPRRATAADLVGGEVGRGAQVVGEVAQGGVEVVHGVAPVVSLS